MEKEKINKDKLKKIFIWIFFVCYLICTIVLVVEASMNGEVSSSQSTQVGQTIGGVIDNVKGDSTEAVKPTKTYISNKEEFNKNFYIGDTIYLTSTTEPENATYKEIEYSSSNETVATISNDGLITCLAEGTTQISVRNTYLNQDNTLENLIDSIELKVLPIEAKDISVTLSYNKNGTTNTLDIATNYDLYRDLSYKINVEFDPINTTNQKVSYEYDENNYFSINSSGEITIKSMCSDYQKVTIKYSDLIYKEIYLKIVEIEEYVPFTSLSFSNENSIEISKLKTYSLSKVNSTLIYNNGESIPTYSSLNYEIKDQSIAKIVSNSIKALNKGTTTLVVTSSYNNSIYVEKEIIVNEVAIESFKIAINGKSELTGTVGSSYSIKRISSNPTDATPFLDTTNYNYTYSSSDTTVATVSSSGKVTLKKAGDTTLSLSIKNIDGTYVSSSNTILLHVEEPTPPTPIEYTVTGFTFTNTLNEFTNSSDHLLFLNKTYDLSNYIKVNEFSGENISLISDKSLSYSVSSITLKENLKELNSTEFSEAISISGSNLTILKECKFTLSLMHKESEFVVNNDNETNDLAFYALEDFTYTLTNDGNTTSSKELIVGKQYKFEIDKDYDLSLYSKDQTINIEEILSYSNNLKSIEFSSNDEIEFYINVTYRFDTITFTECKKSIEFKISHVYVDSFSTNITLIDENSTPIEIKTNQENTKFIKRYINENLLISLLFSNEPTKTNFQIISTNKNIVEVEGNTLKLKKSGKATINIVDTITNKSDSILIFVQNIIKINESEPLIFSEDSRYFSIISAENKCQLKNGNSIKVSINFLEETTYKEITYASSNEEVATIKGGVITPKTAGTSTIDLIINDDITEFGEENYKKLGYQISFTLEVLPQSITDTVSNFFYLIRKSIGHFGAFFVLGVFSSLFYLLKFDKKKWAFSMPINFIQGFCIAALTELIQVFVPGRVGAINDVLIDFLGFSISALIISIIFLVIYFIKRYKEKKKNN